ncbi:hypothetical protein QN372_00750 [Undibacterium sp. RTI2.1]|uniref:hypothetical protein n=1 Tax=unclassified Undibacterium TaxID=2630295 RepID=UPI002AB59BB5|nr:MULTISPECIES: hypothetical protein [unclassified Undibacterium]MDY7537665.1 hypothetical protein [Undibacterium sp. 5I1]MEB0029267.1 hypothetical protein [Undibacterium sp. RTI2.1]MEB0115575.1 hypothetical protein [Undibacterium sp. RTI2.2]MEB0256402.1 hypothetical protein [Undibacterium sp. 5I1]
MDWFRLYGEFAADAKVQSMSESMQRRLIMLFCLRCSNALVTLHDDEIAFALRISDDDLAQTKVLFMRKGFVNEDWEILNWDRRQFKSDSSAERVRRSRAKEKEGKKQDETSCNVTVTPQNRTEQNRTEQNRAEQKPRVTPEPSEKKEVTASDEPKARGVSAADLSIAFRKNGVKSQPADPRLIKLAEQAITPEIIDSACATAKQSKPSETINAGYVIAIIERWAGESAGINATGATVPQARASPSGAQKFNATAYVNQNRK